MIPINIGIFPGFNKRIIDLERQDSSTLILIQTIGVRADEFLRLIYAKKGGESCFGLLKGQSLRERPDPCPQKGKGALPEEIASKRRSKMNWNIIRKIILGVGILLAIAALIIVGMVLGRATLPIPTTTLTLTATPTAPAPLAETPNPAMLTTQPEDWCHVIHDYQLRDLTEVSTSEGRWLHVEYWIGGESPEFETLLPGRRYAITVQFAGGHVWEYPETCYREQVMSQIEAHISRRLAQKANNGGFVPWEQTGYFSPIR